VSRLTTARDLSLIAGAAALVAFAVDELLAGRLPARRTPDPYKNPLAAAQPPVDPPAPHGWLQPVGSRLGDSPRPALRTEADAYARARQVDPAGLVGRGFDGELVLPDEPGYGIAGRGWFHVTPDRDAPTGSLPGGQASTPAGSPVLDDDGGDNELDTLLETAHGGLLAKLADGLDLGAGLADAAADGAESSADAAANGELRAAYQKAVDPS